MVTFAYAHIERIVLLELNSVKMPYQSFWSKHASERIVSEPTLLQLVIGQERSEELLIVGT